MTETHREATAGWSGASLLAQSKRRKEMDAMTNKTIPEVEDEALACAEEEEADEAADEREDMSEEEFEELLIQALDDFADDNDDVPRLRIRTFEESGVLTRNRGLVVRIGDCEYQVTIVRSR